MCASSHLTAFMGVELELEPSQSFNAINPEQDIGKFNVSSWLYAV